MNPAIPPSRSPRTWSFAFSTLVCSVLLATSAIVFDDAAALGETRAGHTLSTTPQRVNGVSPKKGVFVVTQSDLGANRLKAKLGSKASVRGIAAGIEVIGADAGWLAAVVHSLTSTTAHITEKGKQGRAEPLSAMDLAKLNGLNDKTVRYALSRNFGGGATGSPGPTFARSVYPVPVCWKMTCSDCGEAPKGGAVCSELEREKDETYDEYMLAATKQELWQAALQAKKGMTFYGGMAGMIGDMVSAAATVLNAGTASDAARASANLVIAMARDGVLEALMGELGISSLSEMSEAAVADKLARAEAVRVAAASKLEAARKKWLDCMNAPSSMTPAELGAHKRAVSVHDGCRYRVYMGEAPECALKEAPCP